MTLGIIGPSYSCNKIKQDLSIIDPSLTVKLYIREAAIGAIDVIELCESQCDATLFTGRGVYAAAASVYSIKKPFDYIKKSGTSLTKVLLDMQKDGYILDHFSIDVAEPDIIEDTFAEMDLNPKNYYSMPLESLHEQDYIDWHLGLWKEKRTKVILTGFAKIHKILKEQGYPVYYLDAPRSMIRITLERLKNCLALREANYSQIAVEILHIVNKTKNSNSYYSNMLQRSQAETQIINYAQQIQASFFSYGLHDYIIFASKGCIQTESNYQMLYQLQSQLLKKGFTMNAGIGIGATAYQSESHARKALEHSKQMKEKDIYLINETDTLIGPLGQTNKLAYELISSDVHVIELAHKADMSPTYISKLMSIIEIRRDAVFDAETLADYLHISSRSARRILNKLLACDCARICAKESKAGSGRPKNLVEIKF